MRRRLPHNQLPLRVRKRRRLATRRSLWKMLPLLLSKSQCARGHGRPRRGPHRRRHLRGHLRGSRSRSRVRPRRPHMHRHRRRHGRRFRLRPRHTMRGRAPQDPRLLLLSPLPHRLLLLRRLLQWTRRRAKSRRLQAAWKAVCRSRKALRGFDLASSLPAMNHEGRRYLQRTNEGEVEGKEEKEEKEEGVAGENGMGVASRVACDL